MQETSLRGSTLMSTTHYHNIRNCKLVRAMKHTKWLLGCSPTTLKSSVLGMSDGLVLYGVCLNVIWLQPFQNSLLVWARNYWKKTHTQPTSL